MIPHFAIRRAFSSVPLDYSFSARAARPGQALGGSVEVRKSRWIFPGTPATLPLLEINLVSAGFWNTFLSVDIVPDVDVVITTDRPSLRSFRTLLLLISLVIATAAAMVVIVCR